MFRRKREEARRKRYEGRRIDLSRRKRRRNK
jgi:hypothetical protein